MTNIRAFQRTSFDHLGAPLIADGVVGPRTRWAQALASQPGARAAIVTRAISKLGLQEDVGGGNRHPEIDEWLGACGVSLGLAWCAAFASWALRLLPGIAGAQNLGRHFGATADPLPGDVMWYPTGPRGTGHCGIVTGVTLSEVMTIEGNLRNAVRCARRERAQCRFSRVPLPTSGDVPGIPPGVRFEVSGVAGGTR